MRRLSSKGETYSDFGSIILFIIVAGFIVISLYLANLTNAAQKKSASVGEASTVLGITYLQEMLSMPVALCERGASDWPSDLDATAWTVADSIMYLLQNAQVRQYSLLEGPLKGSSLLNQYVSASDYIFKVRNQLDPFTQQSWDATTVRYVSYDYPTCAGCVSVQKAISLCMAQIVASRGIDASIGLEKGMGNTVPLVINKRAIASYSSSPVIKKINLGEQNQGVVLSVMMPSKDAAQKYDAGEGFVV